jgi:hypothetical protein
MDATIRGHTKTTRVIACKQFSVAITWFAVICVIGLLVGSCAQIAPTKKNAEAGSSRDGSTLPVVPTWPTGVTATPPSTMPLDTNTSMLPTSIRAAVPVPEWNGSAPSTVSSKLPDMSGGSIQFIYTGSVSSVERWDNGQILVNPVSPGTVGRVSPEQAAFTCAPHGLSNCGSKGTGKISLGFATSLSAGTFSSDGTITPTMNHSLVYEMYWKGQECPPHVFRVQTSAYIGPATYDCTYVVWVNANDGTTYFSLSGAGIDPLK